MAIWLTIDLIDWKNCSSLFPFLEKMLILKRRIIQSLEVSVHVERIRTPC